MTTIYKAQAVWSGFIGGPGVNTFYLAEEPTSNAPFWAFYDGLKAAIPAGVSVQIQNSGVSVEAESGDLVGSWSVGAQDAVAGTGEGQHVGGAGAAVRWETGVIVAGRRLVGRTYLVPLTRGNYGTDGKLTSGFITGAGTAAVNLALALDTSLGVWSRPRPGLDGAHHLVTSAVIPATTANLSSRKR